MFKTGKDDYVMSQKIENKKADEIARFNTGEVNLNDLLDKAWTYKGIVLTDKEKDDLCNILKKGVKLQQKEFHERGYELMSQKLNELAGFNVRERLIEYGFTTEEEIQQQIRLSKMLFGIEDEAESKSE